MKKLLLGSTMLLGMVAGAAAADLPVYSKAPPPPAWSWTGFYVGVQGGAGWGTSEDSLTAIQICPGGACGAVVPISPTGFLRNSFGMDGLHGGGTAGFNWQTGRIVFGVEGDISGANISGNSSCGNIGLAFGVANTSCDTTLTWFGTVTGRLGVTVDHALLYIKAGGAFAHFNHDAAAVALFGPGVSASNSDNRSGFTVGTGMEYALWGGWSAKVEYDYMDFGTKNIAFPVAGPAFGAGNVINAFMDDRERVHVVRAGLNYRFDWGGMPLFARY